MRIRLITGWLLVLMLVAAIGYAQTPPAPPAAPGPRLSLAEALDVARRNNAAYRQALNDRWVTGRASRVALLSVLTPTAGVGTNIQMSAAGRRNDFFGVPQQTPSVRTQNSYFGLSYDLSGATFANLGLARANLEASEEDISGATTLVETTVRRQYLAVLQVKAQEELAQRSLERAREGLALAQARQSVGQTTLIEVRREQVNLGNAEVALMRAQNDVTNQVLILYQYMGMPAPPGAAATLTDSFPVVEPRWSQEELLTRALAENPALRALRARETSADWSVRSARLDYLPSVQLQAGLGRTSTNIGATDSTPSVTSAQRNPWSMSISISLPIYDRFTRDVNIARQRAARDDMHLSIRERELAVRAEVTAAWHTLIQSYRTIAIREAGQAASAEALELASQRYRVGSGSYIELLDARVAAEQAASDYVRAIYDYHRAIAALENAVGRTIR